MFLNQLVTGRGTIVVGHHDGIVLVGGLEDFLFFHFIYIYGIILPTD